MTPDPDLDARLVARLLGELDAEAAAGLERRLREDPVAAERLARLSGRPPAPPAARPAFWRRPWPWIAAAFAIVNAAGLAGIVSVLEKPEPALVVEEFQPQGRTSTRTSLTFLFNQPMVPPDAVGKPAADALLPAIVPPVAGRFVWDDVRRLRFDPDAALPMGTPFVATVPRQMRSVWGYPLRQNVPFRFHTPALDVDSVRTRKTSPDRRVTLLVDFNSDVAPAELARFLEVRTPGGPPVPFEVQTPVPGQTMRIETDRVADARALDVRIAKGLRGTAGPLGLSQDVVRTLELDTTLRIHSVCAGSSTNPFEDEEEASCIRIACSQEVDPKAAREFIRVEPAVSFEVASTDDGLRLTGPFQPAARYRVRLLPGLKGAQGVVLREEVFRLVDFPNLSPSLGFRTTGLYAAAAGSLLLPMETVNVPSVEIGLERIYENNLVYYLGHYREWSPPAHLGRSLPARTIDTRAALNRREVVPLDLRELLGPEPRGVFRVTARHATGHWPQDHRLVMVTDLAVTVKRSPADLLVWVASLSGAKPVPGASVSVFTRSNQRILEAQTDAEGLVRLPAPERAGEDRVPFAVTAAKDGDLAFVQLDPATLSLVAFDVGGRPVQRTGYDAFVYADRGIYRPGETVRLKALVRAPGPEIPKPFPVEFRVTRPDGRILRTGSAALSAWGGAGLDVEVPAEAPTGRYRVEVGLPGGGGALGDLAFLVEEFLPDRMKAEVSAPERRFRAGESIPFTVRASHLFGAPAAGRAVEARCDWIPSDFTHPGWQEYRFGDRARAASPLRLPFAATALDAKGEAVCAAEVPKGLTAPAVLAAVFTATVAEPGGRTVSAQLTRQVDLVPAHVGLAAARDGHAEPGREASFRCAFVRPDGTAVPSAALEAVVSRVRWNTVLKRDRQGRCRYESHREAAKAFETACVIANGRGVVAFTPDRPGEYELRVRDPGTGASADLAFYCAGGGYVPWPREKPDVVALVPDRAAYAGGETARILLQAPFAGTALLTVEGDGVHLARTFPLASNTQTVEVPVDAAWAPNVYCTVSVVRPVEPGGAGAVWRAFGTVPLAVDCAPHRLRVDLEAPAEVRPGARLRVAMRVRDAAGTGCAAEVSLAAVDEGICRLTRFDAPDPWAHFYARRRLEVRTADVHALLMPEFARPAPGSDRAPGGDSDAAFDPRFLNPVRAKRVRPVALWAGRLETGPDGRATAELDVPAHFTGELRLMAIAAAAKDFGAAARAVPVRQPLLVSASFPRFLAPGDAFDVPATVFNRTGADGVVRVAFDGGGTLVPEGDVARDVAVPRDGEATVWFRARAPGRAGAVPAAVTAALGEESAAERVEIPVRPAAACERIAGSGRVPAGTTARIPLPGGWLPGTGVVRLACAARPDLSLGGGLAWLLQYPYGCVEQTTSRVFPLLYLGDLAALAAPETLGRDDAEPYVTAGIDRLQLMQTPEGGFGYWPGSMHPSPWGSVYATHFLAEARRAGHEVPEGMIAPALAYLRRQLASDGGDGDLGTRAYAAFVLARAGSPDRPALYRLHERRDSLSPTARAHLAGALALADERDLARRLLESEPLPSGAFVRETGGCLHSTTREAAILLDVTLDLLPDHANVPRLVERIEKAARNGSWGTTQESAFALLALGKYAHRAAAEPPDYRATVRCGVETLAAFTHRDRVTLRADGAAGRELEIATEGAGALYCYWSSEGVPEQGEAPDRDAGLAVRRRWLGRDGALLDPAAVPHGAIVIVELTLEARQAVDNVVVSDLLPAGLEIQNPRIVTQAAVVSAEAGAASAPVSGPDFPPPAVQWRPMSPTHVEMRDDRLLLFAHLGESGGRYVHRYLARAVTRGRFRVPAVQAECMYDPEIVSRHGSGWMEVR